MYPVLGAVAAANAIQSVDPPYPFVSVTVTGDPGVTVVALTVSVGVTPIVNVSDPDVPPPGGGVKTVTWGVPATATSVAAIEARS